MISYSNALFPIRAGAPPEVGGDLSGSRLKEPDSSTRCGQTARKEGDGREGVNRSEKRSRFGDGLPPRIGFQVDHCQGILLFHACKSLLFSAGYVEKIHECRIAAIEELFVDGGVLPPAIVSDLQRAKIAREAPAPCPENHLSGLEEPLPAGNVPGTPGAGIPSPAVSPPGGRCSRRGRFRPHPCYEERSYSIPHRLFRYNYGVYRRQNPINSTSDHDRYDVN